LALAPDPQAAKAGKQHASTRYWKNLGQNDVAFWGECQGSALYQVRVDQATNESSCTCPSRKFPCKHCLGLMLLVIGTPAAVPTAEAPDWVTTWLEKRAATKVKQEAKRDATASDAPVDEATAAKRAKDQAKRATQRETEMLKGLDRLDLWLTDLMRNGLAEAEQKPAAFWEGTAAQLVDSKAPGLALRVRQLAEIPHSGADWPERLVGELGRLALLTAAYRRADTLDPALRDDVRQLVGWTLSAEEVAARGARVADDWLILGVITEEEGQLRTQRVWLQGATSQRNAQLIQVTPIKSAFAETFAPGDWMTADLFFRPGAYALRANLGKRRDAPQRAAKLSGPDAIDGFLRAMSDALARQPWLDRLPCVLQSVVPIHRKSDGAWFLRDATGAALPIHSGRHWTLLALSGGYPLSVAGEWERDRLSLLGAELDGAYYPLGAN
jgi:hypothetical protein